MMDDDMKKALNYKDWDILEKVSFWIIDFLISHPIVTVLFLTSLSYNLLFILGAK